MVVLHILPVASTVGSLKQQCQRYSQAGAGAGAGASASAVTVASQS